MDTRCPPHKLQIFSKCFMVVEKVPLHLALVCVGLPIWMLALQNLVTLLH